MYPSDHDFEREREQEQPIPTTGDVSGGEETPKQKKTRGHTGMKVAALCLCCALLGGVAGLAGTAVVVNARRGETTVYHAQTPVSAVEVVDLPASEPLSPAQVYAGNVASCVGITV
ncbi:MAG: serine protease HtrA, partial [Oscillospiraceae bacterium]|nr:serine protease HtrA [Oscillospiraceae bacterium]